MRGWEVDGVWRASSSRAILASGPSYRRTQRRKEKSRRLWPGCLAFIPSMVKFIVHHTWAAVSRFELQNQRWLLLPNIHHDNRLRSTGGPTAANRPQSTKADAASI